MRDTKVLKPLHQLTMHAQTPLKHFKKTKWNPRRGLLHRPKVGQGVHPVAPEPFTLRPPKRL